MPGEQELESLSLKFLEDFPSKIPNTKCLNLIAYGHDILYLWVGRECELRTTNVKHKLRDYPKNKGVLVPRRPPLFEVERLLLNNSGALMCLQGTHGVAVLHLPERWDGSSSASVHCVSLNERLFQGDQHVLRHAKWHPGSPTGSHLVVLTSDECLRCYDACSGDTLWCATLTKIAHPWRSNVPSRISLGDTPVSFDFVSPTRPADPIDLETVEWPILVLWGSGALFQVSSTMTAEKPVVSGPLLMSPRSDDNYGSDACSVIVLDGTPPLVVLTTCSGTIYHSLLMSAEDKEDTERSNELCLYVLETIELDLGLIVGEEDEAVSCPITLMSDPVEKSRYLCIHSGGIHLVAAPVVLKLQEFFETESDFASLNYPSTVNYLLSTAVSSQSSFECAPLLGACFVELTRTLNVLLQNGDLVNLKLRPTVFQSDQMMKIDRFSNSGDDQGLLLLTGNLLKEGGVASLPLMNLPPNTTSQAWLEIVLRTKQHLINVLKTHEKIVSILNSRAASACRAVDDQAKECSRLQQERLSLRDSAETIAEKCEEVNEKFGNLRQRLETVLRNSFADGGGLTRKELNALESLRKQELKLPKMEQDIKRIKTTFEYQRANVKNKLDTLNNSTTFYLPDRQSRVMRENLKAFSDEVLLLKGRLRELNQQLIDEGIIK